MPTKVEIRNRGGVKFVGTVLLPGGKKFAHVFVRREPGKKDSKAIAVIRKKEGRNECQSVQKT